MDKINLGDGTQGSGDSGLVGGGKINANYIALVEAVLGQTIWSTAVSENLDLSTLNTTNKTSLKAAINELLERTRLIDDSLTSSVFKTWSVDKIKNYILLNAGSGGGGITSQQAADIIANNSKVGITSQQAADIIANNSKVGITTQQAADIIFNSTLDSTVASTEDIGGIPAGTTVGDITGDTFSSLFSNMLFPTVIAYINGNPNLAMVGFNVSSLEVGAEYSFTAVMSFNTGEINNGDNTLAGSLSGNALTFELQNPDLVTYVNNSVTNNTDSTTTTLYSMVAGVNTWTFSGTNSAGTTSYTDNKGGADIVASIETAKADTVPSDVTFSKTGYFPLFYGMSSNDYSTGGTALYNNLDLHKNLIGVQSLNISLSGSSEHIYFIYPSSAGDLTSIKDGNDFNVTSSFTKFTANVISTGFTSNWTESYNIYKSGITSVPGQTFKFNF
jgi:hypothetical protein